MGGSARLWPRVQKLSASCRVRARRAAGTTGTPGFRGALGAGRRAAVCPVVGRKLRHGVRTLSARLHRYSGAGSGGSCSSPKRGHGAGGTA